MRQRRQDVTETELSILQVLWDRGPATRRQVTDALYPGGDTSHYATVQKLLERLEAKGYARHRRGRDGVLVFTASVGREELISRRLREVAERLCGGSLTPLLMNLVRARALTPEELRELQDLVRQLAHQQQKGEQA
jgi:predicted transcriptional regulator